MNRRDLIRAGLAGAGAMAAFSAFGASTSDTQAAPHRPGPLCLSAMDDAEGGHFISGIDRQGTIIFRLPVQERGHGGCRRPSADEVVMFSRRPGHLYQVVDFNAGEIVRQIETEKDHHFYGHGVFSPDGNLLYVTANHYPSGAGKILVYDAQHEYQFLGNLNVDGIGPHEIRLHPDGQTLIVALGGIKTHPDYDRIKLNLADMQPALLLINRESGHIVQRHEPSHHQLSLRHLDVSKEGIVIAGYQFEGPVWETPPLIGRLDTTQGVFSEISLPLDQQRELHNYMASVVIDPASQIAALTAPKGNRALLLDYMTSAPLEMVEIRDVAGAIADRRSEFLFTSGMGGIFRNRASSVKRIEGSELRWDNHLTSTGV
jgi:hypothetical protein